MTIARDAVLQAFDRIRVWKQSNQWAPHKPLLILLALGRLQRQESQWAEFAEIEPKMKELLTDFAPASALSSRHYPFWHLATDKSADALKVWQLKGPAAILNRPAKVTPTLGELKEHHIQGGFSAPVQRMLAADPALVHEVAQRILDAHFPATLHQDILDAAGLDLDSLETNGAEGAAQGRQRRRRDPAFREKVLLAYEYRCCVCGFDLRMGRTLIGVEAAHIKWFQAGGPDVENNGLALCVLHHKIFDLGVFTVRPEDQVMVFSRHLVGGKDAQGRLLAYHGSPLIQPQSQEFAPDPAFLDWHRRRIFKEPARD